MPDVNPTCKGLASSSQLKAQNLPFNAPNLGHSFGRSLCTYFKKSVMLGLNQTGN
jgi:hypothetical protein